MGIFIVYILEDREDIRRIFKKITQEHFAAVHWQSNYTKDFLYSTLEVASSYLSALFSAAFTGRSLGNFNYTDSNQITCAVSNYPIIIDKIPIYIRQ